ncbi:hypothetical protein WJX84_004455 [Apatococcus fuscideae]|uniref:Phosphodiesterase n=1 Tax=Apatococcus fuscideae TaxID=2026836 RepID=A0AAW1TJP1_9CHLO
MMARYPKAAQDLLTAIMLRLYEEVLVKGKKTTHTVNPISALQQIFGGISKEETIVNLTDAPFPLQLNGEDVTVCISQTTDTFQSTNPDTLRAAVMHEQSPIHSYLFNQAGGLLLANLKALNKWKVAGLTDMKTFTLEHLLEQDGEDQPAVASAAMKAIFMDKQRSYRVVLRNKCSQGKAQWTQYEMWPATDPAGEQNALLVSTLSVTHQRELELQLEAAKDQLLRQNLQLEASKCRLEADQVKLKEQQAALKARLQQALHMAKLPQTHVDTMTVADKAVQLLDIMLEGTMPDMEQMMAVRNAMIQATDLRQPMNLGDQLLHSSGLSNDVGLAMMNLLQGDSHSSAKQMGTLRGLITRGSSAGSSLLKSFESSRRLSKDVSENLLLPRQDSHQAAAPVDSSRSIQDALYVDPAIVPIVDRLLQKAGTSWAFNVFELADATNNRPLSTLGFYLLKGSGLLSDFGIQEDIMACFLRSIEAGYLSNPYHSRTHAAGVLHVIHLLVQNGLLQSGILDGPMQLACYIAAICHDFEHPGLTNDFLIKTRHQTALTYNDISPLENMHVSNTFRVAYTTPGADFAEALPLETRNVLRASTIELILGTDMKKHFSTLSRFQAIVPRKTLGPEGSCGFAWPGVPDANPMLCQNPDPGSLASLPPDQKLLVAQVALKAADIAHLAAPRAVHQRWTSQLTEEFFLQGDRERALDLKISPLMDRADSAGMVKSQVGFFEIVALPIFRAYRQLIPQAQPMLDGVMGNYDYWRGQQKA